MTRLGYMEEEEALVADLEAASPTTALSSVMAVMDVDGDSGSPEEARSLGGVAVDSFSNCSASLNWSALNVSMVDSIFCSITSSFEMVILKKSDEMKKKSKKKEKSAPPPFIKAWCSTAATTTTAFTSWDAIVWYMISWVTFCRSCLVCVLVVCCVHET